MSVMPPADDFADIAGAPPPGQMLAPQAELIGGDYGGTVTGDPFLQPDGSMTGPLALREGSTGYTYYEGNQYDILKALNTEDRVRLQQQLAAIGLATNPVYGEIDDATVNGMSKLLAMSNRAGTTWEATLNRIATNPAMQDQLGGAGGAGQPEFDVPTYLAPDYASLAQDVKATFRQRLGRDPDQGEMAQLIGELEGWHKGAFDAEVGAARQDFDNRLAEGEQAGGTVRQVDPMSRFQEMFDRTYANELDFVEDKEAAVESREITQQTTGTLSQMSRGA